MLIQIGEGEGKASRHLSRYKGKVHVEERGEEKVSQNPAHVQEKGSRRGGEGKGEA